MTRQATLAMTNPQSIPMRFNIRALKSWRRLPAAGMLASSTDEET